MDVNDVVEKIENIAHTMMIHAVAAAHEMGLFGWNSSSVMVHLQNE